MERRRLAILAGGGPAPGINAVIAAATIEAVNRGYEVIGFYDGFKWLGAEKFDPQTHTQPLDISRVARIHFNGGSILRISRASLIDETSLASGGPVQPDPIKVARVLERLRELGITDLITIGGDDTVLSTRFVVEASAGSLICVHVPKTIDNDLPLPHGVPTFGFSTARFWGTQIVKNLMRDSLTTGRWYFVTAMGRSAGWLAMSVGLSAAATLTLIPEEFKGKTTIARIADVIEGAMIKRESMGRPDGVAVFAEGLAFRLGDRAELARLLERDLPVDAAGQVRLSEIPLGDMLHKEILQRFAARGEKMTIVSHELGYELRSADPTPADMSYCRSLGHGAVQLLIRQRGKPEDGVMVTVESGNLVPMRFRDMIDPRTNRARVRRVDIHSHEYQVARAYMIRLEPSDLENPDSLKRLADVAKVSPEEFVARYRPVTCIPIEGDTGREAP